MFKRIEGVPEEVSGGNGEDRVYTRVGGEDGREAEGGVVIGDESERED